MSNPEFDLVVRNGTIVDGTGSAPYVGDVAIKDGWIAAVGTVEGKGAEEIDAPGMLVTPGFVDIHTHYDGQLIWSDRVSPSSNHGVTTVVTGNCGVGFAPCRPEHRKALLELMEGVEDIPGIVTEVGLTWDWESFPDYLDALDRRPHDIDVAALIPHSPVRVYAMGERALRREPATATDRAAMRKMVRDGLEAGAMGFGTSRLAAHRSAAGEFIPSFEAEAVELIEIAEELRDSGKGVFQIVPNVGYAPYDEQLLLMRQVAKAAGRTLTYTHPQLGDWRAALRMLEEANEEPGVDIKAQLLPRPVGMMLGLTASAHSFCMTPTYLRIKDLPLAERVAEMRRPKVREAILQETPTDPTNVLIQFARRYERIFPVTTPINYEPALEQSIAALADAQCRTPAEVVYDLLLEEDGYAMQMLTIGNYEECSLDWARTMLDSDCVVLGLGDGGAHYGMVCDASFTTHALTYWTRDRPTGRLPVEQMVHRLTREPAELMGMLDRGLIAVGHRANLNVIDYDRLFLHNPRIVADLPAGGKRLSQAADGYVATIVHGEVIVRYDQPTEARPGKLVRGAQSPRPVPATARAAA